MTFFDDLAAAQAEVAQLQIELAAAQANLDALLAQSVKGGPDISQFQTGVDLAQVAGAGYEVLFHRIADGDIRDSAYTNGRVNDIRANDLLLAPYYFGRVASSGNGERNGKSEAAMAVYFAESKGWGKVGDLPLAYDFETLNGQTASKAAKHLMEFVRTYDAIRDHRPFIYTNPASWATVLPHFSASDLGYLANCPLWISHWGVTAPSIPTPWTGWTFWQYTNTGTVPGIAGNVDLNRFAHDRAALTALRIQPLP